MVEEMEVVVVKSGMRFRESLNGRNVTDSTWLIFVDKLPDCMAQTR